MGWVMVLCLGVRFSAAPVLGWRFATDPNYQQEHVYNFFYDLFRRNPQLALGKDEDTAVAKAYDHWQGAEKHLGAGPEPPARGNERPFYEQIARARKQAQQDLQAEDKPASTYRMKEEEPTEVTAKDVVPQDPAPAKEKAPDAGDSFLQHLLDTPQALGALTRGVSPEEKEEFRAKQHFLGTQEEEAQKPARRREAMRTQEEEQRHKSWPTPAHLIAQSEPVGKAKEVNPATPLNYAPPSKLRGKAVGDEGPEHEKIVGLHSQGWTPHAIAAETGHPLERVHQALGRHLMKEYGDTTHSAARKLGIHHADYHKTFGMGDEPWTRLSLRFSNANPSFLSVDFQPRGGVEQVPYHHRVAEHAAKEARRMGRNFTANGPFPNNHPHLPPDPNQDRGWYVADPHGRVTFHDQIHPWEFPDQDFDGEHRRAVQEGRIFGTLAPPGSPDFQAHFHASARTGENAPFLDWLSERGHPAADELLAHHREHGHVPHEVLSEALKKHEGVRLSLATNRHPVRVLGRILWMPVPA